jgi:hypothetical protein
METERLTRARDPRVLRIITGVLFGSTRESNAPYLSVYVKEFQGAVWDHTSMIPDVGFLLKPCALLPAQLSIRNVKHSINDVI